MGGIFRPSHGLWHLQSHITHRHTRKVWRTPKNMLSNQTHVQQNHSQAHHRQGREIHRIQSGCQINRHHGHGTITFPNYGLRRNTRRRVDGPGTKQSPICTHGEPTKIKRTISEPPTRNLFVWHAIWSILHALCRWWRILFLVQDQHRKRDHPPFWSLRSVWPRNAHWHRNPPSKIEWVFSDPKVYLTHKHYRSLISPTSPWTYKRNTLINRDAHARTKNTPSAEKHWSSK